MRMTCIQMDMALGEPEKNFYRAEELIRKAAGDKPDVIVLPETWNVGFFPREGLEDLAASFLNDSNAEIREAACYRLFQQDYLAAQPKVEEFLKSDDSKYFSMQTPFCRTVQSRTGPSERSSFPGTRSMITFLIKKSCIPSIR